MASPATTVVPASNTLLLCMKSASPETFRPLNPVAFGDKIGSGMPCFLIVEEPKPRAFRLRSPLQSD